MTPTAQHAGAAHGSRTGRRVGRARLAGDKRRLRPRLEALGRQVVVRARALAGQLQAAALALLHHLAQAKVLARPGAARQLTAQGRC